MFRFQHFGFFWLLLFVLAIIFVYILYIRWKKDKEKKLGNPRLINNLIKGRIGGRPTTKFVLSAVALLSGIIGLANLQKGNEAEKVQRKGVDVVFALDVSKSMLAKDVSPDRLSRAKLLIQTLMNKMSNNRVGLVIFAGRAYLQSPLTIDYASAKMLLSTAGPDMVPSQGTVLGDAIEMADAAFNSKDKKYKTIVLISDGEDHDQKAMEMAEQAAKKGIIIHTVGIGSAAGAPIFDPATGQNKIDNAGNEIISKLNEKELQDIAKTTNGTYQSLTNNTQVADNLNAAIAKMEEKNMGAVLFASYSSYFQYFLLASLLLLVIDWFIPAAKSTLGHSSNPFKSNV